MGGLDHKFDPDDDALDGVLFRFWIRMASYPDGHPGDVASALAHCVTPAEYRTALVKLAEKWGVNLPELFSSVTTHQQRGLKGGNARAANLSPARRHEIAKHAADTRWGNRR